MENITERKSTYDRNLALLNEYREGSAEAGEQLALLNAPLVYSLAVRFSERGELSDLVECGNLGLVKAMQSFDPERGCAFSTYAVPLIMGEMRRFLRDDGIIKVSREEKRLSAILNRERERRQAEGEDSSIEAIAEAVGVSVQDAASAIFATVPPRSLDERAYDDEDSESLGATVSDEDGEASAFDRLALYSAIENLPSDWRKIIILRYFRDLSQQEVARIMGITQVKVSREEKKIMAALKKELS
jgi:RNA polymerase sporulation-specific sigma factor